MTHSNLGAAEPFRVSRSRRYSGEAASDDLLYRTVRQWKLIVVITLLGAIAGLAGASILPETYTSEARLRMIVGEADILGSGNQGAYESADEAARRMETTAATVLSDATVSEVAATVGDSADAIRDRLRVEPVEGTNVLSITADGPTAESAANLAQTTAEVYRSGLQTAATARLVAAADAIEARAAAISAGPLGTSDAPGVTYAETLQSTALELRTRAALYEGSAELLVAAPTPERPASVSVGQGAVYGLALGFVVAFAVAGLTALSSGSRQSRRRNDVEAAGRGGGLSQESNEDPGQ